MREALHRDGLDERMRATMISSLLKAAGSPLKAASVSVWVQVADARQAAEKFQVMARPHRDVFWRDRRADCIPDSCGFVFQIAQHCIQQGGSFNFDLRGWINFSSKNPGTGGATGPW